ncbi:hypothetical protein N9X61_03120 [Sulfurimonas sp.]|nr:hypothetical protein [Sulfurimonas sp.]
MMYKLIFSIFLILSTTHIYANESEAKELFEESDCTKCHSVDRFKYRKDKVNNFEKLHRTVNSCVNSTSAGWFEEEIKDVSSYLNAKYYHFKEKVAK